MLFPVEQLHSPNFEDRRGYKPILFVLHITDGQDAARDSDEQEERAVRNTFMSPASQCSCHDEIDRDGGIVEYVPVEKDAWTQGLHGPVEIRRAPSPIVRNMGVNPNLYSISIEFLAYKDHGGDGTITEEQFWAACWRIKYRQDEVQRKYGHKIPLNSTYVIGHCHVDPVTRAFDPGKNFPWARLYAELAIADNMSLADYEGRIQFMRSGRYKKGACYQVFNEVDWLAAVAKQEDGVGEWARGVLRSLYATFAAQGVLEDQYTATDDHALFRSHVLYIYNCSIGENGPDKVEWSQNELMKVYPSMLQSGLVNTVA